MTQKYICKSINLIPLYNEAKQLEQNFDYIKYNHIYRHDNKIADQLCNKAVEEYIRNM